MDMMWATRSLYIQIMDLQFPLVIASFDYHYFDRGFYMGI